MTPALVFRDPYFLDFLGLDDHYIERDVEDAIMRELEGGQVRPEGSAPVAPLSLFHSSRTPSTDRFRPLP